MALRIASGVLTWLTTRPVIESKRLPELVSSQLRYIAEPRTWCRMASFAAKKRGYRQARHKHGPGRITGDLLNEQVTNCLSSVFAFRSTERGEAANVMSLLGGRPLMST